MITLAIDASTYVGDVAVVRDAHVLAEASVAMKGADEERLMPAVAAVLARAGVAPRAIERVVCGAGPGSFTSLRIAGAIAKGIAAGVGAPLFAVPSMALIAGGVDLKAGRYLVVIDALRAEAYVGLYTVSLDGAIAELEPARLVGADEISRLAAEYEATLIGPAPLTGGLRADPRARAIVRLSTLLARGPVDTALWEPAYGRLAEAQVRWESAHGRPLPVG